MTFKGKTVIELFIYVFLYIETIVTYRQKNDDNTS